MAEELNRLISICEKERPGYFNFVAHENMSQDDFNKMHVWFEIYRGEIYKPHEFFLNGTFEFKYAVERFNQVIHMWELIDPETNRYKTTKINFDIFHGKVIELEKDDLNNFRFECFDDTIYLSYIMRGKNIMDLWQDNDHHIGDANIRPYKYLGSSFLLMIKGPSEEKMLQNKIEFDKWFHNNSNYLNSLGFYKDDVKSTIGYLPLAHSTLSEIKSIIEPRQFLKKIKIFEE